MAVSLKASEFGLELADKARKARGWMKSQPEWSEAAGVAPASLKRFWIREPIKKEKFIALCNAIEIDWRQATDIFPDSPGSTPDVITKMKLSIHEIFERPEEANPMVKIEAAKAYAALVMAEESFRPTFQKHAKDGTTPTP